MTTWLGMLGVLAVGGAVSLALGETNTRRAVTVAAIVTAALWAALRISVPAARLASLADSEEVSEYVTPLLKCVGITYAAAVASVSLRELGAQGAANAAGLVGAAELCVIALPLVTRLVTLALSLV